MKKILFIVLWIPMGGVWAQTKLPLDIVKDTLASIRSFECQMTIDVEVPGIEIPRKQASISYYKGEKSKIKAEGMVFLPRRGMPEEYLTLLDQQHQAIELERNDNLITYKLVSLEKQSDWVTADLQLDLSSLQIHYMLVRTAEFGSFEVSNQFGTDLLPIATTISFEADKIEIPLKFLGGRRTSMEESASSAGQIYIQYADMKLTFE